MPRQISRSSAAQAALAAILVIGVMVLLVMSGHDDDVADRDRAAGAGSSAPQELAGGFTTIVADEFFETVTAAQKAADSWRVVSISETDGQPAPASVQDVSLRGDTPAIRLSIQSATGPLTGVYVGGQFYVKGLTGKARPWWKVPTTPAIEDLLVFADPEEFLAGIKDPESFEVIGVESTDAGNAVHYRIGVDATTYDDQGAESGTQPVDMELWVDAQDRPVQAITTFTVEGRTQTTTLVYSSYGQRLDISAPPANRTTTKQPSAAATPGG